MRRNLQQYVLLTGLVFAAGRAQAVVSGDVLPEISVKHHQAGQIDQSKLQGKVTLINFWATWCAACKIELKEMEDQFRAFSGEKDFQVAYVSLDKESGKAVEWFNSNLKDPKQMLENLFLDPAFEAAEKLKVESFPMTFIIGRDGKVAQVIEGFKEGEHSTDGMVKTIGQLLRR